MRRKLQWASIGGIAIGISLMVIAVLTSPTEVPGQPVSIGFVVFVVSSIIRRMTL